MSMTALLNQVASKHTCGMCIARSAEVVTQVSLPCDSVAIVSFAEVFVERICYGATKLRNPNWPSRQKEKDRRTLRRARKADSSAKERVRNDNI
jgi:hypothetical protein